MLDLSQPHFKQPPHLAKPLLEQNLSALECIITGPGTIPPPGSVSH
jgi:hypothetical protein